MLGARSDRKDVAGVSSKKDKLIEEAQRLALRGQLDKAIKAYEQVMALEPSALNHRQKLAELLVRAGRTDDARAEFEAIGKKFTSDGFYLKAIAVYKKLQGLFPGDIPVTLTLAGLNEKHGLVANAMAEYKLVYDYYEKSSSMDDALKILEKMQNVDPQNINIKHKLAEAYFQVGQKDEAYAVFGKLATLLQERGDSAAFAKLDTRIQQLFPKKSEFALEVLAEQVANGNASTAVSGLQALLRINSNDKRIWELIVEAFTQLGQPQKVKVAFQHYLKCFPNEPSAQLGFIGCLTSEKDLKGALVQLDNFELGLFAGRYLDDLEGIYRALDKIDPINLRVLEGLNRVCIALGKTDDAAALQSKILSLQGVSGKSVGVSGQTKEDSVGGQGSFGGQASDEPEFDEVSFADIDVDGSELDNQPDSALSAEAGVFDNPGDEVDIEVEFDVDDDDDFEIPLDTTDAPEEDWLDSVSKQINMIAVKPSGVKFACGLVDADAQSHYDLGVAFREMGLYDEAINEFSQSFTDPGRRLGCIILQGACLRDKGDLANAEKVLKALLKPGLGLEDASSVKYELALTYGDCGKKDQLIDLLSEIDKSNSGFRDVRARLDAANRDKNSLNFSDDDLQGFDLN
jgi:tetratricopeptide (TPR) repeat protein